MGGFIDVTKMPTQQTVTGGTAPIDYSGLNNPFTWSAGPGAGVPSASPPPLIGGGRSLPVGGAGFFGSILPTLGALYHVANGGLKGMLAPPDPNMQSANPLSVLSHMAPINGFLHPQQAIDRYNAKKQSINQSIQNSSQPGFAKGLEKFGVNFAGDTLSDPLSYVPFGKVASAVKLPEGLNMAKNAAMKLPGAKPTANVLSSVFKPIAGARQPFVDAVSRMHGSTQSGANKIMNQLQTIFKGVPPETRIALTHAMESTAPGTVLSDPTLEALRQHIEPILAKSTQTALDRGLIQGTINPAEYGVGRYIPHVSATKLDENAAPFSDISLRKTGVDAGKSRTLEGTIQALNAANPEGHQFEPDMAKILAFHLGQANKSVAVRDLIDHAMQNGLEPGGNVATGDWFPNTVQKAMEYSHDGKTALLPEAEANYLKGLNVPTPTWKRYGGSAYKGTVNTLNKAMFLTNPLIHILNNLGTQTLTHDPGIFRKMPQYMKEAFTGVQPGSGMDKALQSGALHLTSEIGKTTGAKDMANAIAKKLDTIKPTFADSPAKFVGGKIASGFKKYNSLTPNMEKVYRTAAFDRGLEKGMSPEESTNRVRSMYGGNAAPGTASPFEMGMSSLMPFYNWTKTAIGSNLKNAARNPLPYVAGYHALDDYNQQVTGHGMGQNPNPLSIGLPWQNKSGNPEYWTPYAPPFDAAKLGKDVAQNGMVGGLGDFAMTRFNPLAKYATQMLTHEQNPMAVPQNKFNVDPYPALPSQFNKRGVLFGDKGPKVSASTGQLLQDISNPISDAMQVGSQSPRDAILSKLFGGAVSTPNPLSKQKEQAYQSKQAASELKSWLKKQAQGG